jgi:hypothetical protein
MERRSLMTPLIPPTSIVHQGSMVKQEKFLLELREISIDVSSASLELRQWQLSQVFYACDARINWTLPECDCAPKNLAGVVQRAAGRDCIRDGCVATAMRALRASASPWSSRPLTHRTHERATRHAGAITRNQTQTCGT